MVPVGSVTGDVDVAVPVNDVAAPLAPDGLTAVAPLVVAMLVGTPDPVTPGDDAMPVEPGDAIEELPGAPDDGLPFGADMLEPVDGENGGSDERDDVRAVCVSSNEIPLLPSTDPVWTLEIGLQAIVVVTVGAGGGLGGVSEGGFGGTCAAASDAHAMLIQMNKASFIGNLLYRSAVRFTGDCCASRQPHTVACTFA